MSFVLHPQLAADTALVGDLELCQVRLMDDARYPWLILVPRRVGLRESYQLEEADRARLWLEADQVAAALARHVGADKMNLAALGNQVPQLHIHCIARFEGDDAWPRPVWGAVAPRPYEAAERRGVLAELRALLGLAGEG